MRKPRFGLDADGCVYDFDFAAGEVCVEMGYKHPGPALEWNHIQRKEPEAWSLLFSLGADSYKLFRRKDAIVADARTLVTNLKSLGYEVILVTSRAPNAEGDTRWLAEELGCDGYEMVKTGEKYTVGCDIHLDDSPVEIIALIQHATPTIIMDKPWNVSVQGEADASDCWIAEDFRAVIDIAREYLCGLTQEIEAVTVVDDEMIDKLSEALAEEERVVVPIQVTEAIRASVQRFSPAVIKLAENDEPRGGPCAKAIDAVYGDRERDYRHPLDDFTTTAALWTAAFGFPFEAKDVAVAMWLLKTSRLLRNPTHEDSLVDVSGYVEAYYRVLAEQARRHSA